MSIPPIPHKPTPEELAASVGKTMPDVIAPHLKVMFCGINPSVYSVVVGHHFARPGNRFWPALQASGFTPRRFLPTEDGQLLDLGLGITNIVDRSSVAAADLSARELTDGAKALEDRMRRYEPRFLAILGVSAYRAGFGRKNAVIGLQEETIGPTRIWVLPNPSGLNAHYHPPDLARLFGEFREFVEAQESRH